MWHKNTFDFKNLGERKFILWPDEVDKSGAEVLDGEKLELEKVSYHVSFPLKGLSGQMKQGFNVISIDRYLY